jgi:hypothetical protein
MLSINDHAKTEVKVLDVFPADCPGQRLVVLQETIAGHSQIILQQESHSTNVGWFTQSRVAVNSNQLCGLKTLLSGRSLDLSNRQRANRRSHQEMIETDVDTILAFPQAG